MQQAQRKALETYQENLIYLANNHSELHEKLLLLDTAISNEIYVERYVLEYKDEAYFDVLEVESGEYLYGENSVQFAQQIVDSIDFTRTNGVFEAQRFVDFSPDMPDIIDQSKLHFHNALWASIKLIEYSKKVAPREITHMKVVYKLLFLGIGLGVHIQGVVKKLGAKILFMQENNLELFRLSLFVINYARLAKNVKLFFSIMEDEISVKKTFVDFLETGNNYNLYLKQISLTREYEKDLFSYQSYVMNQDHIMYPYSAYLLRYIDSPRYVAAGHPFINVSHLHHDTYLSSKPLLFLFSGPSTAKNVEWIKENKDRFIIVTALSTCRYLSREGIKPDILIHIDPESAGSLQLIDGMDKEFFENIICLFASNTNENVVNRFSPDQIYFIQQSGNYKHGFGEFSSPTVGEFAYAIFLIFGAQELYLLGLDLALDPDTLSSHSPEHPFAHTANREDMSSELDKTLIEVAGNLRPTVPTYPMYKISINEFSRMSGLFKNTQQVYNLGDGALLVGASPMKIADFSFDNHAKLDRYSVTEGLKSFFDSISSSEFREEDKEVIRYQLKEAKKLKEVIENFKKSKFAMPSLYIDALGKFQFALSDMEKKTKSDLAEVNYYYFKVVFSYICEIFNTKELTKPKEHIDAINAILIKQLEKMSNLFITTLEGYLNERD